MRKFFLLMLCTQCVITSCTQNESLPTLPDNSVAFTSSISSIATRITDSAFENTDAIGVYASNSVEYIAENVKYEYNNDIFTSSTPITYGDDPLLFIANYPYVEEMPLQFSMSIPTEQSTESYFRYCDWLNARTALTTESCPTLNFNHSFSSIELNISSTQSISAVTQYARTIVDCDLETGEFTESKADDNTIVGISPLATGSASYTSIVAPQTIEKGASFIELVVDGKTLSWNTTQEVTLESGYKYTCYLTISDDDIIFEGIISPWTDGEDIDIGNNDSESSEYSLSDFANGITPEGTTWVIIDETASGDDFSPLREALTDGISLEFPNLTSIPNTAFMNCAASFSISAPNVLTIEDGYYVAEETSETAPKIGCEDIATTHHTTADGRIEVITKTPTTVQPFNSSSTQTPGYYGAFSGCSALTSVSLASVSSVGYGAFYNCTSLSEVSMPVAQSLGSRALYGCSSLSKISLPIATTIGSSAFLYCSTLTDVSLPEVTSLGSYAFYGCSLLSDISLPKVQAIEYAAFAYCYALSTASFAKATSVADAGFYLCYSLKTISLPSLLTTDEWSFYACSSLSELTFEEATTIGGYTFYGCSSMKKVSMPKVETIGISAFNGLTNLSEVSLPSTTTVSDYAFYGSGITEISLPEATSIGSLVFHSCTSLQDVSLPLVTTISASQFYNCTSLVNVSLPAATTFGKSSFDNCTSLTEITLPAATSIESWSFCYCTSLTDVTLPVATSIGQSSFAMCSKLQNLNIATTSGTILEVFAKEMFCTDYYGTGTNESNISLNIGSANSNAVSNNTLTIGDISYTFNQITLL
ncbi:MAG: leucine-rich repeat protein [Rikenellaceae bacterium]